MLDGEIVIDAADGQQDFGALQQRIHPAASRIALLAEQTPAHYVAFDLLAKDDESLLALPFAERRARLEELLTGGIELTPLTRDPEATEPWFAQRRGRGGQGPRRRLPPRASARAWSRSSACARSTR